MLNRLTSGDPNGSSLTEPLTARETAVLLFLADGLGKKRSAGALHQHSHAPQPHPEHHQQARAHSKLEAVSIAIREGLITAPGNDY